MKRSSKTYLGFDLGAGSGRAVLGFLERDKLRIREIHRFVNSPVQLGGTLYWNFLSLWANILDTLRTCAGRDCAELSGIGVDTWGVDFGLVGRDGCLIASPVHYRDDRTRGIEGIIARTIDDKELYRRTGHTISRPPTLSQLVALRRSRGSDVLDSRCTFLMMPDLFRYFLCGDKSCELTALGSSQLVDVRTGRWCSHLFRLFDLPLRIMPRIIKPATIAGDLLPQVSEQTGLGSVPVIATAGHDTASAAAAVPFVDAHTAFASCGTWSVLGIANDTPTTSENALRTGFINEFGLNSMLFVKNLTGLFLVETLRRQWTKKGKKLDHTQMTKAASAAKPFKIFIDTTSPMFFTGDDLEAAIVSHLRSTGQKTPRQRGRIIRAVLEGLAFSYRQTLTDLVKITGRELKRFCLVGGGTRNTLFCQMLADATGLEVIAGPPEATVVGNLAIQALATGQLGCSDDIRTLVARSFKLKTYQPRRSEDWTEQAERHAEIVKKARTYHRQGE